MNRIKSHFEKDEPFLENLLRYLRFNKIFNYISINSNILDLGCGYNGKLLKSVSAIIKNGVGIDISINKEVNLLNKNITLISHNLNNKLPLKNNEFDIVISLANLEHLNNPENNLREIYRVLKPGGILLLITPSIYAKPILEFMSFKLHLISRDEIMDHKNYFNKKLLLTFCKKIGFSYYTHNYFQFYMNNFLYAKK